MGGGKVEACGNELQKKIQEETGWAPPFCSDVVKPNVDGGVKFERYARADENGDLIEKEQIIEIGPGGRVRGAGGTAFKCVLVDHISHEKVDTMRRIIKENSAPRRTLWQKTADMMFNEAKSRIRVTETILAIPFWLIKSAFSVFSPDKFRSTAGDIVEPGKAG